MSVRTKFASGVTAVWGTSDSGVPTVYGKVTSCTGDDNAEHVGMEDENGETCGMAFLDDKAEYSIDIICKTSMTKPTVSSTMTIGGAAYLVMPPVQIKWENKGWKKMSLKITKFVVPLA